MKHKKTPEINKELLEELQKYVMDWDKKYRKALQAGVDALEEPKINIPVKCVYCNREFITSLDNISTKKKLSRHYSGKKSVQFWDRINAIKGSQGELLYSMGVALQDMEGIVLRKIEEMR